MWQRFLGVFALVGVFFITPAHADYQLEPGLWETTNDFKVPGLEQHMAEMQAALENMPPELRAQFDDQMAQAGIGLAGDGTIQMCITPEEAAATPFEEGHTEDGCTHYDVKRTGNQISGRMKCVDGEAGTFEFTRHGRRHFESLTVMETAEGSHQIHTDARWLAADCGNVQP